MGRYLIVRVIQSGVVALLISMATFFLLFVAGNPVQLMVGETATTQQIAQLNQQLGLNQPILVRYARFANGMLHGDFGESLFMRGEPALQAVLDRLPATLELAAVCLTSTLAIALAAGAAWPPSDETARSTTRSPWARRSGRASRASGWASR